MGSPLTDAQLDQIAAHLFICRDPATTKLPKPTNSTDQTFTAKLDPIGNDKQFGFTSYGVVDLSNVSAPKIWLHKPAELWRIASTAKLALILAAVQLRDDVRWLVAQGFIKNGQDGDALFSNKALWRRAKNPMTARLAKSKRPPRISSIFDFTKSPVDFIGPVMTIPQLRLELVDRLAKDTKKPTFKAHLRWSLAPELDFTERLWLAGARSDNVAATSCISEIGVAYIKAVQVAYGLYDLDNSVCMFLASGYCGVDTSRPVDSTNRRVKYRSIEESETVYVLDALQVKGQGYTNHASTEAGNVFGLMMFLIAWRQGKFIDTDACDFITTCLSDMSALTTVSRITQGLPASELIGGATKIGLLDVDDHEPAFLNTDFAYVEMQPTPGQRLKLGMVVTGIRPDGTPFPDGATMASSLGEVIYHALTF